METVVFNLNKAIPGILSDNLVTPLKKADLHLCWRFLHLWLPPLRIQFFNSSVAQQTIRPALPNIVQVIPAKS